MIFPFLVPFSLSTSIPNRLEDIKAISAPEKSAERKRKNKMPKRIPTNYYFLLSSIPKAPEISAAFILAEKFLISNLRNS